MRWTMIAMGLAALLSGCAAGTGPAPVSAQADADRGGHFAAWACASCHAVGEGDRAKATSAPPFRELAVNASRLKLQGSLDEIARHGHMEMPPINLSETQKAELLAYFDRLRGQ
jgi:cytochrome c553